MLKKLLRVFPVIALSFCAGGNAQETCRPLGDLESALTETMALFLNISTTELQYLPSLSEVQVLTETFPHFSKCAGSLVPMEAWMRMVSNPKWDECRTALDQQLSSNVFDQQFQSTQHYLNQVITNFVCPFYKETITPCVKNILFSFVEDLIQTANGCCDDLLHVLVEKINTREVADELLSHFGDLLCSSLIFEDQQSAEQSCGVVLIDALFSQRDFNSISNFLEIPSDQICPALRGDAFYSKNGLELHLFPQGITPLDACYLPVSSIIQEIKDFLVQIDTRIDDDGLLRLSDLFEDTKCLSGQEILDWILSPESSFIQLLENLDQILKESTGVVNSFGLPSSDFIIAFLTEKLSPFIEKDVSSAVTIATDTPITEQVKHLMTQLASPILDKCIHIPNNVAGCQFSAKILMLSSPSPEAQASSLLRSEASRSLLSKVALTATIVFLLMAFVSIGW